MADTILALAAALAVSQPFTLSVHLRDDARVGSSTLDAAKAVVCSIYAEAGISVLWSDDPAALTVILRPRASQETTRRAGDAMGYTPGGGDERGRLAFVMINRVNEIAGGYSAPRHVVLAVAIAHELGHLLLGPDHGTAGIMKPYLNQTDFRKAGNAQLTFTEAQSQRLRKAVPTVSSSSGPPGSSERR